MGFDVSFFQEEPAPIIDLGDNRVQVTIAGVTVIARVYEVEYRRGHTTRQCEIEEIHVSTLVYQTLPEEMRERAASIITIVEP